MSKHPDAVFGKDGVTFADVVQFVKNMDAKKLDVTDFDDIINILTYMRDQQITLHEALTQRGKELDEKAAALDKRENEVRIRMAAAELILNKNVPIQPKRRSIWG